MKPILLLIAFLTCTESMGQITVITSGKGQAPYSQATRERYRQQLRKDTTIFILQYRDYDELGVFDKAIRESWTCTPYKIIRPEALGDYKDQQGYAFFTFGAYYTGKHHHTQHLTYSLWHPMLNKKGRMKAQYFYSTIHLYPEENKQINMLPYYYSNHKYDVVLIREMLGGVRFNNWNAGLLGGYLKVINAQLEQNKTLDCWNNYNSGWLADLKKDTLYIPSYTRVKEQFWRAAYYLDSSINETTVKADYPYPVKFVSNEELDQKLRNSIADVHYLLVTIDGSDKYIDVFSSTHGLLYNHVTLMSWTFKGKDMAHLAKVVD